MLAGISLRRRASGLTLIEMMIAIVILSILVSVAMPSFRAWLRNIQIRNATESVLSGMQRARSEGVGRNLSTSFVLGNTSDWSVNVVAPASVIETRLPTEGSEDVTRVVQPAGATTISFNNLGVVIPNADASATITQVDFSAGSGTRTLRVTIGVGGSARMCDPGLASGYVGAC